jgi:DnaJ-related protein SCJ1
VKKQVLCPVCDGTGAKSGRDLVTCSTCQGHGIRIQRVAMGPFIQQMQSTCDVCQGKGKMIKEVCSLCKGRKVSKNHREISVSIRKGMQDGETIVSSFLFCAICRTAIFLDGGASRRRAS